MQYWSVTAWHHCREQDCIPDVYVFPIEQRDVAFAAFALLVRAFIMHAVETEPVIGAELGEWEHYEEIWEVDIPAKGKLKDNFITIRFDNEEVETINISIITMPNGTPEEVLNRWRQP